MGASEASIVGGVWWVELAINKVRGCVGVTVSHLRRRFANQKIPFPLAPNLRALLDVHLYEAAVGVTYDLASAVFGVFLDSEDAACALEGDVLRSEDGDGADSLRVWGVWGWC